MSQRRSGAAVAVLDNMLYAIGGHDGPDIRKSVERWVLSESQWIYIVKVFMTLYEGFLYPSLWFLEECHIQFSVKTWGDDTCKPNVLNRKVVFVMWHTSAHVDVQVYLQSKG